MHPAPWGRAPLVSPFAALGQRRTPAVQRVAGMFPQDPPPDSDVPGRREHGERPELVAEVGRFGVTPMSSLNPFGRLEPGDMHAIVLPR